MNTLQRNDSGALGSIGLTIILCRQSAGSWGFEVQRGNKQSSIQVCKISPNSPAQCGGLVQGDDILAIDGIAVEQLVGRVSSVLRGNQTTQVKLQIIPHVNITKRSSLFLSDGDQVALNLVRKNLKAKWGLKFQVNSWTKHLLVVDSAKGSICLKAGVLPGDRVVSINGQQVANGANPIAQANELMAASTNVAMIIERREYWATKVPMQATIVMPLFPQNMAYTVPQQQMGYPQQQQQPPPQYQTMDRNGAPPTEKGQMEHPPQYPQQTEKGQMGNPPQQPQQIGVYPPQQQPPNYPPQQQQQQQQPPIYPPQQPTLNNGQNAATANMLANSNDGPIYEDMNETPDINNRAVSNPAYDNTGAYMEVLPPSSSNDDRTSLI